MEPAINDDKRGFQHCPTPFTLISLLPQDGFNISETNAPSAMCLLVRWKSNHHSGGKGHWHLVIAYHNSYLLGTSHTTSTHHELLITMVVIGIKWCYLQIDNFSHNRLPNSVELQSLWILCVESVIVRSLRTSAGRKSPIDEEYLNFIFGQNSSSLTVHIIDLTQPAHMCSFKPLIPFSQPPLGSPIPPIPLRILHGFVKLHNCSQLFVTESIFYRNPTDETPPCHDLPPIVVQLFTLTSLWNRRKQPFVGNEIQSSTSFPIPPTLLNNHPQHYTLWPTYHHAFIQAWSQGIILAVFF